MSDHADHAETLAERAGSHASQAERASGEGTPMEVANVEATLAIADATLSVAQRLATLEETLARIEAVLDGVGTILATEHIVELEQTGDDVGPIR